MVIDMCSDRSTLLACALTCRAWLPRTRYNLLRIVDIHDHRQLACFAQFLTKNKAFDALVAEICIHLPPDDPRMLSLFPALLARKVTKCTRLHILRASSGPPLQIHPSTGFFVLLPEFSHITKLILTSVVFSSLTELTSLVLYIRGLLDLRCTDVRWEQLPPPAETWGCRALAKGSGLLRIDLDMQPELLNQLSLRLVHLQLVSRVEVLHVTKIQPCLDDTINIGYLLQAARSSLRELHIGVIDPPDFESIVATVQYVSDGTTDGPGRRLQGEWEARSKSRNCYVNLKKLMLCDLMSISLFHVAFHASDAYVSLLNESSRGAYRLFQFHALLCQIQSRSMQVITVDTHITWGGGNGLPINPVFSTQFWRRVDAILTKHSCAEQLRSFTLKAYPIPSHRLTKGGGLGQYMSRTSAMGVTVLLDNSTRPTIPPRKVSDWPEFWDVEIRSEAEFCGNTTVRRLY